MRSVDTNVLVRLITRDDRRQTEAAERFVAGGAWVPHIVLAETLWVLESVYDRTRNQLATLVEMLLAHQQLVIQDPETIAAALDLFRSRPRVDFSDCLILETSRKAGHLKLATFDRDLSKCDGSELI
jgi:predicted nucleic-acid-binding protein